MEERIAVWIEEGGRGVSDEGEEAKGGREEQWVGGESCEGIGAEKDRQAEKRERS